jgi:hypothetical protein
MVVNCDNPAGAGTHMAVTVPQIGAGPMTVTGPVCEEHWFGNWHRDRRQLEAENARLRQRLAAISALASDEPEGRA